MTLPRRVRIIGAVSNYVSDYYPIMAMFMVVTCPRAILQIRRTLAELNCDNLCNRRQPSTALPMLHIFIICICLERKWCEVVVAAVDALPFSTDPNSKFFGSYLMDLTQLQSDQILHRLAAKLTILIQTRTVAHYLLHAMPTCSTRSICVIGPVGVGSNVTDDQVCNALYMLSHMAEKHAGNPTLTTQLTMMR